MRKSPQRIASRKNCYALSSIKCLTLRSSHHILYSLLSVHSQLYDVDTGAFIIGQNNIYFCLEDVLMITGLPIDGKPVVGKTVTREECETFIGVISDKNEIKLIDLVDFINGVND